MRAQKIGGDHWRDEPRDEQGKDDGDGDGEAKLAEILSGDAGHETDRRKHRYNRRRNRDHRQANFIRRFQRGAIGRFTHAHMTHDILDLDNRVVDENASDDGDGEQADQIEREAQHIHRPEGRDGGQRQRDGGS